MKIFIKLILIIAIAVFGVWNYRLYTFSTGISKTTMEDKSVIEIVETLIDIEKIEYYKKTIKDGDDVYTIFVQTDEDGYLINATKSELEMLKLMGEVNKELKPEKITIIPFYVDILVALVILLLPTGKKSKK